MGQQTLLFTLLWVLLIDAKSTDPDQLVQGVKSLAGAIVELLLNARGEMGECVE